MAVNGAGLAAVAAGSVFVYAGLKGYSITQSFQDVLLGKSPARQNVANPIGDTSGVAQSGITQTGPSSATGAAIAQAALQYKGHPYCFGGAQGAPSQGCPAGTWDCSSFVNWVLGHDMKLDIPGFPGGSYNGDSHGPSSFTYAAWDGCVTIGHDASVTQAGDLCIWMNAVGHIGIAIGGGQMISALDPTDGTLVTPITGTASGIFLARRLKQTIAAPSGGGGKR